MNEKLQRVKDWWDGLTEKQQRRAAVVALFVIVLVVAALTS